MKSLRLILCGAALLGFSRAPALAQSTAEDQFMNALLLAREAEQLEVAGDYISAEERLVNAIKLLDNVESFYPDWKPEMRQYRKKFCQDKLAVVKPKAEEYRKRNPAPVNSPSPALPSGSPEDSTIYLPEMLQGENTAPTTGPGVPSKPAPMPGGASRTPTMRVSKEALESLQQELTTTRKELLKAREELASAGTNRDDLKQKVAELEKQILSEKERLAKASAPTLLEENNQLKERLVKVEASLASARNSEDAVAFQQLRDEAQTARENLGTIRTQNEQLAASISELKTKLRDVQQNLAQKDMDALAPSATAGLMEENSLLKIILERQLAEQTRRMAVKRDALQEVARLNPSSPELLKQLEALSAPFPLTESERQLLQIKSVVKAAPPSAQTQAPKPPVAAVKTEPPVVPLPAREPTVTVAAAPTPEPVRQPEVQTPPPAPVEPPAAAVVETPPPIERAKPEVVQPAAPLKPPEPAAEVPQVGDVKVPKGAESIAKEAEQFFNEGKLEEAAIRYASIVEKHPGSVYGLGNLGIVRLQQGKYPEAETALKEAVRLAPEDGYSVSALGILYCLTENYESAYELLTRASKLMPEDQEVKTYLQHATVNRKSGT